MVRPYNILANLITIAVCVAMIASLAVFVLADGKKLFSLTSPLVYAFLVSVLLVVFLVINIVQELRRRKQAAGKESVSKAELLQELQVVGLYTAGLLLYVFLLRYLHFLIGSLIFLALGMFVLNKTKASMGRKALFAGVASVITVPILYVVFSIIFDVILP
jgi:hypothetical protein